MELRFTSCSTEILSIYPNPSSRIVVVPERDGGGGGKHFLYKSSQNGAVNRKLSNYTEATEIDPPPHLPRVATLPLLFTDKQT
jgi:hypothetical protein